MPTEHAALVEERLSRIESEIWHFREQKKYESFIGGGFCMAFSFAIFILIVSLLPLPGASILSRLGLGTASFLTGLIIMLLSRAAIEAGAKFIYEISIIFLAGANLAAPVAIYAYWDQLISLVAKSDPTFVAGEMSPFLVFFAILGVACANLLLIGLISPWIFLARHDKLLNRDNGTFSPLWRWLLQP